METGVIIGIVVAALTLVAFFTIIIFFLVEENKKNLEDNKELMNKRVEIKKNVEQKKQKENIKTNLKNVDDSLKIINKIKKKVNQRKIENNKLAIMKDGNKIKKTKNLNKQLTQSYDNIYSNNEDDNKNDINHIIYEKKAIKINDKKAYKIQNVAYLNIADGKTQYGDKRIGKIKKSDSFKESVIKKDIFIDEIKENSEKNKVNQFDVFKKQVDNFFDSINDSIDRVKITIDCNGEKSEPINKIINLEGENLTYLIEKIKNCKQVVNITNYSDYGATQCFNTKTGENVDLLKKLIEISNTKSIIYTSVQNKNKKRENIIENIYKDNQQYSFESWNNKQSNLFIKDREAKPITNKVKQQLLGKKKVNSINYY